MGKWLSFAYRMRNFMDRLNFAAIDIGSNAVRLLIKGIYPGESVSDLSKVFIVRVPLRLGQDTFTKGRISTEKTEKLLRLMHAFFSADARFIMSCLIGLVLRRLCGILRMEPILSGISRREVE